MTINRPNPAAPAADQTTAPAAPLTPADHAAQIIHAATAADASVESVTLAVHTAYAPLSDSDRAAVMVALYPKLPSLSPDMLAAIVAAGQTAPVSDPAAITVIREAFDRAALMLRAAVTLRYVTTEQAQSFGSDAWLTTDGATADELNAAAALLTRGSGKVRAARTAASGESARPATADAVGTVRSHTFKSTGTVHTVTCVGPDSYSASWSDLTGTLAALAVDSIATHRGHPQQPRSAGSGPKGWIAVNAWQFFSTIVTPAAS